MHLNSINKALLNRSRLSCLRPCRVDHMDKRGGGEEKGSISPLKTGGEHGTNRLQIAELHMHQLFLIQYSTASLSKNSFHADQRYITFLTCLGVLFTLTSRNIKTGAGRWIQRNCECYQSPPPGVKGGSAKAEKERLITSTNNSDLVTHSMQVVMMN